MMMQSESQLHWLRMAADQGWASAQADLARMYESGVGVEQDQQEATKWYRLAADTLFWH